MSAVYAKQMGIPIRKLICASNHNHIVVDVTTEEYDLRNRLLVASDSPAMDILKSSHLERFLFDTLNGDGRLVRDLFFKVPGTLLERIQHNVLVGWCFNAECLVAIHDVHLSIGYILDMHTAVTKVVSDRLHGQTCPVVISSTVHHGKFAPAVLQALQLQGSAGTPLDQPVSVH
ncbi:hypothetical protein AAFF_G00013950 [Aldrovandia affinis]|uniref:Uncharacterized protein n=1 Tax=Aldrovandia affinis TaxID=143900 RepID=A0AAD7S6C5_9TELE|nr:hypothetical protein AAFF_G00013950 [Aldrovandia affinis]